VAVVVLAALAALDLLDHPDKTVNQVKTETEDKTASQVLMLKEVAQLPTTSALIAHRDLLDPLEEPVQKAHQDHQAMTEPLPLLVMAALHQDPLDLLAHQDNPETLDRQDKLELLAKSPMSLEDKGLLDLLDLRDLPVKMAKPDHQEVRNQDLQAHQVMLVHQDLLAILVCPVEEVPMEGRAREEDAIIVLHQELHLDIKSSIEESNFFVPMLRNLILLFQLWLIVSERPSKVAGLRK